MNDEVLDLKEPVQPKIPVSYLLGDQRRRSIGRSFQPWHSITPPILPTARCAVTNIYRAMAAVWPNNQRQYDGKTSPSRCPPELAAHGLLPDVRIDIARDGFISSAVKGGVGRLAKTSSRMKTSTSALVCSFSQKRSSSANRALIDASKSPAGLLHSFARRLVQTVLLEQVE